ncbi:hypothetical protein GIY23_06470 [Allosaccharopolyspora coralli]|uniref:Uncharacterized protein n=1 Tax=Allosaccharopolyspora coralli TaxID=2665642 RepID=A0A5Q3Q7R7_9PSEU|nr:hypothetical protein [Allosaccharopolyspora coralli]QGK69224.1 hypothetical protein GIY23_06470 [Allosaccharopolyspora coralli]
MSDEVRVGQEQLRQMASALRSSTDELDSAAKNAPGMPEVSTSADKMSHTLGELSQAAAGLIATIEEVAGKIDASDGSYGDVDNRNAERLQKEIYDEYGGRPD